MRSDSVCMVRHVLRGGARMRAGGSVRAVHSALSLARTEARCALRADGSLLVARCARDGAEGGVASLRVADMRRRSCGWATCWPSATHWHHTSDRAAHPARSAGTRRLATPPPAPYLKVPRWEGSGRELRRCTVPHVATTEAAPLSCPLRGHPQSSPAMSCLGPQGMGPRRIRGGRGASRAGTHGCWGTRGAVVGAADICTSIKETPATVRAFSLVQERWPHHIGGRPVDTSTYSWVAGARDSKRRRSIHLTLLSGNGGRGASCGHDAECRRMLLTFSKCCSYYPLTSVFVIPAKEGMQETTEKERRPAVCVVAREVARHGQLNWMSLSRDGRRLYVGNDAC
jgi:hypothetical protein